MSTTNENPVTSSAENAISTRPDHDHDTDLEFTKFLADHYRDGVFVNHNDYKEAPKVSTFYEDHGNESTPPVHRNVGPFLVYAILQNDRNIEAEVGTNLPFFGYKKLIELSGDVRKGPVKKDFHHPGLSSGSAAFYLDGNDVDFDLSATLLNTRHDYKKVKFFTIST